jgi:hypothetical protein
MDEEEQQLAELDLDEEGDYDEQLEKLSLRYSIPNAIGAMERMSQSTETARARLKEARDRILARQYDKSLPWFAAGAALGAPTKSGSFGETLGNLNEALAGPRREQMAFNRQKDEDLLGVDTALLGMDKTSLEAAIKMAQLRAKMQDPAATREWEYFVKHVLPKGQKTVEQYLEVKRNAPWEITKVDQVPTRIDRTGRNAPVPLSTTESEAAAAGAVAEAQKEGATIGEGVATAKLNLPDLEGKASYAVDLLERLRDHEGMAWGVGATSDIPAFKGADVSNFRVLLSQLEGQRFLEAYASLRGTGQITEKEGAAAAAAKARLSTAQSEKEFRKAANEYIAIVKADLERARKKAREAPVSEAAEAAWGPRIKTETEWKALKSGAKYIAPDGSRRTKK